MDNWTLGKRYATLVLFRISYVEKYGLKIVHRLLIVYRLSFSNCASRS
jgi:hypothetical protein